MKIPFVDLKSLHSEIKDELCEVFDRVLDNSTFVLGPEVLRFEQEFAAYCRNGALRCSEYWNGRNSSGSRSSEHRSRRRSHHSSAYFYRDSGGYHGCGSQTGICRYPSSLVHNGSCSA